MMRLCYTSWLVVLTSILALCFFVSPVTAQETSAPPVIPEVQPASVVIVSSRIVTLEGETLNVTHLTIDSQGVVHGLKRDGTEGGEFSLPLMALRRIDLSDAKITTAPVAGLLYEQGGGVLRLAKATIVQRNCAVTWPVVGEQSVNVPLGNVRALLLQPPSEPGKTDIDSVFAEALASTDASTTDRVFVSSEPGKPLQSVACLLESLDEQQATVVYNDKSRTIAREKIYGLILANPAGAGQNLSAGQCLITTTDGSRLLAKVEQLDGQTLNASLDGTPLAISREQVARIDVRSDRLVFLSDLQPVEVTQSSFPAFDWPWRRDVAVMGQALQLGGRVYDKGLGVHARCLLTFAVPDGFDTFAATVGLQPPVRGKGDCEMAVLADGKEVWRQRVRGTDEPLPITVEIRGAKRITLAVEPGEDLDLADHADWADARFIRGK